MIGFENRKFNRGKKKKGVTHFNGKIGLTTFTKTYSTIMCYMVVMVSPFVEVHKLECNVVGGALG